MTLISNSPEQTKQIAADLASELQGGEVILLEGGLGAGKTTFVQGFVSALGSPDMVRSPTFSLMNVYAAAHPKIKTIIHLDFYRLTQVNLDDLGLDEWLGFKNAVILAEWPPADLSWPAKRVIRVWLKIISFSSRRIIIDRPVS